MALSGLGPDDSGKATLNPSPCPAKPGKGEKGIPEKWETDSGDDENRTQNTLLSGFLLSPRQLWHLSPFSP